MATQKPKLFKIQVFVPATHQERVRLAIGKTGAGRIGNYDFCASVMKSTGYFRPLENSDPAIGKIGEIAAVEEVKIEFPCEEDQIPAVVKAINESNIYEENMIDIIPMVHEECL